MNILVHRTIFLLFFLILLTCGCSSGPAVKQPAVTVSDISLAGISLTKMTVNTTVVISNPNPVGANLNRVGFDVEYLDGTPQYLGHGEVREVDIAPDGNTSVTIPVTVGNLQALKALGSLSEKGAITLRVNGSAAIDMAVAEYEVPFTQEKEFAASEFEAYLPVSAIASINVSEKIGRVKDFLSQG